MLRPLYFKENFDFKLNELYVRREDGVKMLYSSKQTRCLYPDETEINTFLSEKLISSYMEFGKIFNLFRKLQTIIIVDFRVWRIRQDSDETTP